MISVTVSPVDFVEGDEDPEGDDVTNLLDPPPKLSKARLIRLELEDFSFFTFFLGVDLSASSLDLMLSILASRELVVGTSPSMLLSTLCPETGESEVGDAGLLRKGC